MDARRTELRDELTALIAAGRELPPDHDQVLAEVFIDRVERRTAGQPRTQRSVTIWRKPRRLVGAVVLGLACLATGSVLSVHHVSSPAPVQGPLSAKPVGPISAKPVRPMVGKMPVVPSPKMPGAPPAPKAPSVPQAPAPKSAP